MAQSMLVELVDDLDGTSSEDVSTVLFGLDGVSYEIDLNDENAQRLRDIYAEYVDSARRIGGQAKRGTRLKGARASNSAKTSEIRSWALNNGFEIANHGRVPTHIVEAHREAQQTTTRPNTRKTTTAKRTSTRRTATKRS